MTETETVRNATKTRPITEVRIENPVAGTTVRQLEAVTTTPPVAAWDLLVAGDILRVAIMAPVAITALPQIDMAMTIQVQETRNPDTIVEEEEPRDPWVPWAHDLVVAMPTIGEVENAVPRQDDNNNEEVPLI